jgi:tetratricopeptide (TPR) repeat protein
VKFCPNCRYKLSQFIVERGKFCPDCGADLQLASGTTAGADSTNISNTQGGVFGTGITGSGTITGKEISYTVQGNVINLQISGDVSREVLDTLQRIVAVPTQVNEEAKHIHRYSGNPEAEKSIIAHQQIQTILNEVNNIEKNTGTQIQEIKVGNLQISRNELLLKKVILKGNEAYYRHRYDMAIEYYDNALDIDANDAGAWYNKASALHSLWTGYESVRGYESVKYYKAFLEIDPKYYKVRGKYGDNKKIRWYTSDGKPVYK